jgi:hypothetical protein
MDELGALILGEPPKRTAGRSAAVISDELLDRLRMVESGKDPLAVNKETKAMGPYQFLPETVQMLHKQGVKFNPFDERQAREAARTYLGQLAERHGGNIELALKDYGGFVTKDPSQYIQKVTGGAAPAKVQTAAPTDDLGALILGQPTEGAAQPRPTGKVASAAEKFLRRGAGFADTVLGTIQGLPGTVAAEVTYPFVRAGEGLGIVSPGTAEKSRAAIYRTAVEPYTKPVGKMLGVTETPEYKGEATQQLMQFVSQNLDKGADWISKQTGVSKADAENMINTALAGVPGLKSTKAGQAVSREVGYAAEAAKAAGGKVMEGVKAVTPGVIQRPVTRAVEAIAPGTTTMPTKAPTLGAPGAPTAAIPPAARASVGAAGVPDTAIVRQALTTATPEFQQLYGNLPLDKANTPVIMRHLEADSLPIPVRLTKGQSTGDVVQLSKEQNLRGSQPDFARRFDEQNRQLVENVPLIREKAAPDVYATKTIESSQAIIDAYKALDDVRSAEVTAAYKALEDAAGGQFPVDGVRLATNAERALSKKLKTDFLPSPIKRQLDRFKAGEPMTFEQFEAMRTNLAAEIRKAERAGDGNAAMAAGIVREALENLPLKGEAATLKPLADQARSLAKARFDALKKDPAYKAAIDDAVPADKYFDKFVVNGINKNINTMVETLGRDSVAHQHMKAGTINWLSDKAGIIEGKGNFSQANYNKAVKKLDDVKNFEAIFDPESQLQLRTLGNVAAYTQFQPRGSFINNSNTLVGYLANKAAGGLEQAGNILGLKTFGYPIGSEARRVIRSARERREAQEALRPGAGSTLDEIRKGQ